MGEPLLIDPGVVNPRLRQLLGPGVVFLHPVYSAGLLIAGGVLLLPLASRPEGVLLAALSTYLLLMAVRLEQRWLTITPLPPLTILCLGAWLRCGLGGVLIALGKPMAVVEGNSAYWRHLPAAQILWVAFMAAALVVFACWPPSKSPEPICSQKAKGASVLRLAMICGLFSVASISLGVAFGTLDRDPSNYLYWVTQQRWRPDSFFTMLARFRDIFFLIAPLAISKAQQRWQRVVLVGTMLVYILLSLLMGGRGLLLYPIIYAVLGIWLTPLTTRVLRPIIVASLVFSLIAIPSIDIYRDLADHHGKSRGDFIKRFELLLDASVSVVKDIEPSRSMQRAGIGLYGCSDAYLFEEPARSRPRAGLHRLQSVLMAWVPELLVPKAVPVRDSHIIAEEIRGRSRKEAESMVYVSFPCVSFGADLYWRGGWAAVFLGSALAAFAYRLVSSIWYRYSSWNSVWQILLILYPATFLSIYPAGSVGETAWLWMWDLPKYVILIGGISWINGKLHHNPSTSA